MIEDKSEYIHVRNRNARDAGGCNACHETSFRLCHPCALTLGLLLPSRTKR